jgi:DNA-binding transcriptional MerR regulator
VSADSDDEPSFSAGDVRRATGLSSRQLNDWDQRGALPHEREGEAGWRRFTLREIFVLMVCAEMRKRFGIPVDRLKVMKDWMLQEEANHLEAAIEIIGALGVDVWILTDFETTFVMDSDLEIFSLTGAGALKGDTEHLALLKVNPIVNRLLGTLKEPIELANHGLGYQLLAERLAGGQSLSPVEQQVLRLLRDGLYDSIEVTLRDGVVERIRKSKRVDANARIGDLIRSNDYQQIRLNVQDGQIVLLEQSVSEKP